MGIADRLFRDEYEEEELPTSNISVYNPTKGEYSQYIPDIATDYKKGSTVLINISKMKVDQAQRLLDFMAGMATALDGAMKRISGDVIIFTPKGIAMAEADRAEEYTES